MTPEAVLLALIGALLIVVVWFAYRLTNSTGAVTWAIKTTAPEPSNAMLLELTRERDDARKIAERLRAELEGRSVE